MLYLARPGEDIRILAWGIEAKNASLPADSHMYKVEFVKLWLDPDVRRRHVV